MEVDLEFCLFIMKYEDVLVYVLFLLNCEVEENNLLIICVCYAFID